MNEAVITAYLGGGGSAEN
ncbi:MAG: hypothetical protein ACLTBV_18055 [Enterocloster bolteae]